MTRIFLNGALHDYVVNPFDRLAEEASTLNLAAPYFTKRGRRIGQILQPLMPLNQCCEVLAGRATRGLRHPVTKLREATRGQNDKLFGI
jgi:hypothetical protein